VLILLRGLPSSGTETKRVKKLWNKLSSVRGSLAGAQRRSLPSTSSTSSASAGELAPETTAEAAETRVLELLGWGMRLDAMTPLIAALGSSQKLEFSPTAAVCLDANAYLRLQTGRSPTELIDYFAERHAGPLIVSTQALQELWNNHLAVLPTVAEKLGRQLGEINKTVEQLDTHYSRLKDGAMELVSDFKEEFGHVLDAGARRQLLTFLNQLNGKAIRSQVSHAKFAELARLRKQAKTPPGFRDDGDGDFYVWAELLSGLIVARSLGRDFDRVILVTNDVKKDWSASGQPHPILVAEVDALLGVPFQVMTLDELKTAVAALLK
jgi:hypothetical protein